MKTMNSKLHKAGMELLTMAAVFFATCFMSSAQGAKYGHLNDVNPQLAFIETIKGAKTVSTINETSVDMTIFAELLYEDYESGLTIENWMTDAKYFGAAEIETEFEQILQIEDWMINVDVFNPAEKVQPHTATPSEKNAKTAEVTYPGIQSGRRAFILIEMKDPKLRMESWMMDKNIWNAKQ